MLEFSDLSLKKRVWVIFLEMISPEGVTGVRLNSDSDIRQGTAWHLLHRIREGLSLEILEMFKSPVEVDEAYIGGFEKNQHGDKRLNAGRRTVGNSAILGVKGRETKQARAELIQDSIKQTMQRCVNSMRLKDTPVFTDDHLSYKGLTNHTSANNSQKQWVVSTTVGELARTNVIESFWATLKRAYCGTFHHLGKKRLNRHVMQLAGKHNLRDLDAMDHMKSLVLGIVGKRLRYDDLTTYIV